MSLPSGFIVCVYSLIFYFLQNQLKVTCDLDVSAGVDLRSSKVCELGLLNYKAKHVFYPLERKKYRCHFDYYWASVFKVIISLMI